MAASNLSNDQKAWGVLSYLWIVSIVALVMKKNDDFIRFHANQGLLLFVCSVVVMLVQRLAGWPGYFLYNLLNLLNLVILIVAVIGIVKAWQGEKWEIPVIGQYAKGLGDWIVKTFKL